MRRALSLLLPAALLSVLCVGGFGFIHAVAIAPIWSRLLGGLPFAFVASLLAVWAFQELFPLPTVLHGLALGAFLWFTLVPNAALRFLLTQLGLHAHLDPWEDIAYFLFPFVLGAFGGVALTGRLRGGLALASASSGFTVASAGALALFSGGRPLHLGLGLLPLCLVAGLLLVVIARTSRLRSRAPA